MQPSPASALLLPKLAGRQIGSQHCDLTRPHDPCTILLRPSAPAGVSTNDNGVPGTRVAGGCVHVGDTMDWAVAESPEECGAGAVPSVLADNGLR